MRLRITAVAMDPALTWKPDTTPVEVGYPVLAFGSGDRSRGELPDSPRKSASSAVISLNSDLVLSSMVSLPIQPGALELAGGRIDSAQHKVLGENVFLLRVQASTRAETLYALLHAGDERTGRTVDASLPRRTRPA